MKLCFVKLKNDYYCYYYYYFKFLFNFSFFFYENNVFLIYE